MSNLYCTIADGDFASYGAVQEIISISSCRSVKEKELPAHIVIGISFFTGKDKQIFLEKIAKKLPAVAWREKP